MDQPSGNGTITQEIQWPTHPSVIRPVDFPHNLSTNQLTNLLTNRPINSSSDHLRKFSQQIFERYINMTTNEPTKQIDQPISFATDQINHSAYQHIDRLLNFLYWFLNQAFTWSVKPWRVSAVTQLESIKQATEQLIYLCSQSIRSSADQLTSHPIPIYRSINWSVDQLNNQPTDYLINLLINQSIHFSFQSIHHTTD